MSTISISTVLVDDHEITRLGLRMLLELMSEINIVAEVATGKDAVNVSLELRPDLVLMDIGLPDMNGIEATRLIKESLPSKVIMITSHTTDDDVLAGLTAGADAYCLKGVTGNQLSNAIHSVMEGAIWLDPLIAKQLVAVMKNRPRSKQVSEPSGNPFQLSEREQEVLSLLVHGMSNQQMATKLCLSAETVKTHMRRIMEKLSVSDRTQAAVKAVKEGLVADSGDQD
jgi:NarL family two-component system response regulator LiaR